MTVDVGTQATTSFPNCAGFTSTQSLYSGTLAGVPVDVRLRRERLGLQPERRLPVDQQRLGRLPGDADAAEHGPAGGCRFLGHAHLHLAGRQRLTAPTPHAPPSRTAGVTPAAGPAAPDPHARTDAPHDGGTAVTSRHARHRSDGRRPSGRRRGAAGRGRRGRGLRPATALKLAFSIAVVLGLWSVAGGGTWAALSGTTSNAGDTFSAGTVTLTDNDSGGSLFTFTNQKPGVTSNSCIKVTYTGSVTTSALKLYATAVTGSLAPYLNVTVTRGTDSNPSFSGCTNFTADATNYNGLGAGVLFNGTLSTYPTAFASGVSRPDRGVDEQHECLLQVHRERRGHRRHPGAELGRRPSPGRHAADLAPSAAPTPPMKDLSDHDARNGGERRCATTAWGGSGSPPRRCRRARRLAPDHGHGSRLRRGAGNPGDKFTAAPDWKPPIISRATVLKSQGGHPRATSARRVATP